MRVRPAVLLSAACLAVVPIPVSGQFLWGGHLAQAGSSFGGTHGLGLSLGVDLGVLPIDVVATGEYFFPVCPPDLARCGLKGHSIDVNYRLVVPVLRPYVTGGMVWRRFSPGGDSTGVDLSGLSMGGGVSLSMGGTRLFGEARLELTEAPRRQVVTRVGLQRSFR
jgi:hypothetical protein